MVLSLALDIGYYIMHICINTDVERETDLNQSYCSLSMKALNGDFFVYEFIKMLLTFMAAWRLDNLIFLDFTFHFFSS